MARVASATTDTTSGSTGATTERTGITTDNTTINTTNVSSTGGTTSVPEPFSITLLGLGATGLFWRRYSQANQFGESSQAVAPPQSMHKRAALTSAWQKLDHHQPR